MNFAAVVILYNPDKDTVNRILTYGKSVQRLYIFDNTEGNHKNSDLLSGLSELEHTIYLQDGENKGISYRLNQAIELCSKEGYEWLLTMDQDSFFPTNNIPSYFHCLHNYKNKERTAMFGVQFLNVAKQDQFCDSEEVAHLITSGSVLNVKVAKEIGNFDEALFIDKVDHEFCLRAQLHNYKIVRFNNIFLHHNLGSISYGRSLKNLKLTPRVLHAPVRMYYILRNYLYLREKYKGQFKSSFLEMQKELRNRIKNNFIYGTNRVKLIEYLLKGYRDYKKKKMGKL